MNRDIGTTEMFTKRSQIPRKGPKIFQKKSVLLSAGANYMFGHTPRKILDIETHIKATERK
jgi:hypothetical protein